MEMTGSSDFVREQELEALERALVQSPSGIRVIDIVGDPGIGKSRLLHEFHQRIGEDRAVVLSGSCSIDSRETPFFPFIGIVRDSFRISANEAEEDIAQKLEAGLTSLGLHSAHNLGLMLYLLDLKVPDDALAGFDSLLIRLRTREVLQQLLEARCWLAPAVMMIEDLQWIDSASEELLSKTTDSAAKIRLLLLTTRRPEYSPPWLDSAAVTKLPLRSLPAVHIRRIIQSRLGVDVLPEPLIQQVAEKAEGNPLFAEEIVSYLNEQGVFRATVDFDPSTLAAALPASVQHIDRLAPDDRALQAASAMEDSSTQTCRSVHEAPDFGPQVKGLLEIGNLKDTPEIRSSLKFELELGWVDVEIEREHGIAPLDLFDDLEKSVEETRKLLMRFENYRNMRNIIFDHCVVGEGTVNVVTAQDLYARGYSKPRGSHPLPRVPERLPPNGSMAVINRERTLARLLRDLAYRKPRRKRGGQHELEKRYIVARAAGFFRAFSKDEPTDYAYGPFFKFCKKFYEVITRKTLSPNGLEKMLREAAKNPHFEPEKLAKKPIGGPGRNRPSGSSGGPKRGD
jgi:AAA ATPase domain